MPETRLMIIGHGPHRPALEALAGRLGLSGSVIWAGYHEDDLPEHFRAADVTLFTARGSDEGHRAILESMACGTAVASMPIDGVAALLAAGSVRFVAEASTPESLARVVTALLAAKTEAFRTYCATLTSPFGFEPASARLIEGYERKSHVGI